MFTCKKCGFSSANTIKKCKKCGVIVDQPKSTIKFSLSPNQLMHEVDWVDAGLKIFGGLVIIAIIMVLWIWLF